MIKEELYNLEYKPDAKAYENCESSCLFAGFRTIRIGASLFVIRIELTITNAVKIAFLFMMVYLLL